MFMKLIKIISYKFLNGGKQQHSVVAASLFHPQHQSVQLAHTPTRRDA